jgi:hypothetical protein
MSESSKRSTLVEMKRRTVDGRLTAQLLQHLGCSGQSVTRFADRNIEDEFLDAQFAHRIRGSDVAVSRLHIISKDEYVDSWVTPTIVLEKRNKTSGDGR